MTRQILAISSQVAYGPVGNSAAVPALQAAGFSVVQVPTIILSNHPGHGKPAGLRLPATDIAAILAKLQELGVLDNCMGVMTGYFAAADQAAIAAAFIQKMQQKNPQLYVLVDPVLGDDDSLYVPQDVAAAIRDGLLPLANCITPNCFELAWLAGKPVATKAEALSAVAALGIDEVLATSIPVAGGSLATLAISKNGCAESIASIKPSVPHGTGDFLAGLYLSHRLRGFDSNQALRLSSAILETAISRSLGLPYLDIIGTLYKPS